MKAGFDMWCDFKNCRFYLNGECTDEKEQGKCPLMEVKITLRVVDDTMQKLRADHMQNLFRQEERSTEIALKTLSKYAKNENLVW